MPPEVIDRRWAEKQLSSAEIAALDHQLHGSIGQHRYDSRGVQRPLYTSSLPVHFIKTPRPKIGGRNTFIAEQGIFCLASEEGTFRVISITQANQGSIEILDWKIIEDSNPDEPMEFKEGSKARPIACWAPPILGPYQLDANFSEGLVVRITGGHGAPMMTVVWYLASDIGNGR